MAAIAPVAARYVRSTSSLDPLLWSALVQQTGRSDLQQCWHGVVIVGYLHAPEPATLGALALRIGLALG